MIVTLIVIGTFLFFGLAVLLTRNSLIKSLREGFKIKKLEEKEENKECCGGNCHCNEK